MARAYEKKSSPCCYLICLRIFFLITCLNGPCSLSLRRVLLNICIVAEEKKCGYLILSGFLHATLTFCRKTNSFVEAFSCLSTACRSPLSRWCINGQKKAESCAQTEHSASQSCTVIMPHSRETR